MSLVGDAAEAYVWGLPLVTVHRTRARAGAGGRMVARRDLASATDRTVVAPNHDTLYSSGWFDLARGDLEVTVGPLERYWSVMLVDAHTHVRYVSRRTHGGAGARVRVVLDPAVAPDDVAPSADVVPVATRTVWVLVRVVVRGPDDLAAARAAQDAVRVLQDGGPHAGPPVVAGPGRRAEDLFVDLAAALAVDPPAPWHPAPPPGLGAVLAAPDHVLAAGAAEGERRLAAAGIGADRHRDGWGTRCRGAAFGDDALYRAAFARTSLAGHLPAESRSYGRPLDGSRLHRLRMRRDQLPPVDGFWSLTVYGPDLHLWAGAGGRHSVGDRTPGIADPDGGVTVLVGHPRPEGDLDRWLPAPPGPCALALRAYEGRAGVVGATWFPPALEPV